MLEACVAELLRDENVPEPVVARTLEKIIKTLQEMEEVGYPAPSLVENISAVLRHSTAAAGSCVGPKLFTGQSKRRVSQIITQDVLTRYMLDVDSLASLHGARAWTDADGMRDVLRAVGNMAELLRPGAHSTPAHRATWVTSGDELKGLDPDAVRDELGMLWLDSGEDLYALEYSVSEDALRIPTIIEGGLQPWFVPKPSGQDPRAWNWDASRWGLTEFVHQGSMPLIDPAIRYLGRVESKAPRDFPLNQRIEFAQSPDANEFLAGVLNQVQAHLDLAPFLSGASDFVSLTPREFEHFVGATFARSGYRTTVTKASRDGGVDVIAVENVATNEGFLIQAKHTRSTVGVRVVRELAGARYLAGPSFQNYRLAVVTSGRFSNVARDAERQFAATISLHDFADLTNRLAGWRGSRLTDIVPSQMSARAGNDAENHPSVSHT